MRLTIATYDDQIVNVEVENQETLQTLRAIVEAETGVPAAAQQLTAVGSTLTDDSLTLGDCKLSDGDVLTLMRPRDNGIENSANSTSASPEMTSPPRDPVQLLDWLRNSPRLMAQLRQNVNPPLMEAVRTGDAKRAAEIFFEAQQRAREMHLEEDRRRQEEADLWNADPMDIEAQTKIAERINQQQIAHNFEQALEHNPEIFGQVDMLYVEFEVNRHSVAAFVDSGAQITIVGLQTAQTLGIAHLIDKRFAGIAKGVGSGKIVGRIHQAPMRVGGEYLSTSLTVMENDQMPFLFGLDMMRRHQVQIDLKENMLRFPHLGVSLPFLPPHQIQSGTIGRPQPVDANSLLQGDQDHSGSGAEPNDRTSSAARLAGAAAAARAAAGAALPSAAAPSTAIAAAGLSNVGASSTAAHGSQDSSSDGKNAAALNKQKEEALRQQAAAVASGLAGIQHPAASTAQTARSNGSEIPLARPEALRGSHDEDKIQQLLALGFARPQVEEALSVCSGNVEQAASYLYGF